MSLARAVAEYRSFEDLVAHAATGAATDSDLTREECLAATRRFAEQSLRAIRRRHDAGESGSNIVHMLADTADHILRGVFHFGLAEIPGRRNLMSRVSLCARGGYGRSELSPHSDLDVCLLYEGPLLDDVQSLNRYLISFLWDIGFDVGYSLHPVRQAMDLAAEDLPTFTSFLESRLVAGSNAGFARLKLFIRELQSGPLAARFVERKVKERHEALTDEHRDLFNPEPNVKEGAGGLRDFHTALWLLMMAYGATTLDEADAQGVITPEEHLEFAEGLDFLWRIRNELHFHAGERMDLLTFDNQRHLANAFGYDAEHHEGIAQFMQDYYQSASRLRRFLRIAARACDSTTPQRLPAQEMPGEPDLFVEDGLLYAGLGHEHWFAHNPARLMRVFWECTRQNAQLSRVTERMVVRNLDLVGDAFRSSDVVRRLFMAIFNRPLHAGHALRLAANTGLLGRYLPEFAAVQGVIRYQDFHHYPVDEHILRAIEALTTIQDMQGAAGSCLREALENLSDPYVLVAAILFHDLGKASGDVHTEESVRLVHQICRRIGVSPEDEERIAFLVQHHMAMTHLSQYRDIDDEHTVRTFARTMMTEQRLRALFILSYADLCAVAPNVWNDWKGTLLLSLYLRAMKHLLGRAEGVDETFWTSPKADEVRRLVREDLRPRLEQHLRGLGDRYFIAFTPDQIALHLECVAEAHETGLAVQCTSDDKTLISEVVVCTRDRQGLFAEIAGSFSSRLIDIGSAALFTRTDGWVVDRFTVTDASRRRPLTPSQFVSFEQVLRAVLLDGKGIQEFVDRARRRLFALLQPRIPVPTRIDFDNHSSRKHTVIDIETGDRTGLLYDVARAMADSGLDISTARIVTDVGRVRDSFYVTKENAKIETDETQAGIREAIHNAIHPRST